MLFIIRLDCFFFSVYLPYIPLYFYYISARRSFFFYEKTEFTGYLKRWYKRDFISQTTWWKVYWSMLVTVKRSWAMFTSNCDKRNVQRGGTDLGIHRRLECIARESLCKLEKIDKHPSNLLEVPRLQTSINLNNSLVLGQWDMRKDVDRCIYVWHELFLTKRIYKIY